MLSAGALSSFVPDSRERRGLMEAVGETCEQQGQFEQARELYLAAPNPCAALRIMNRQLSDLISSALTDTPARGSPAAIAECPYTLTDMPTHQSVALIALIHLLFLTFLCLSLLLHCSSALINTKSPAAMAALFQSLLLLLSRVGQSHTTAACSLCFALSTYGIPVVKQFGCLSLTAGSIDQSYISQAADHVQSGIPSKLRCCMR